MIKERDSSRGGEKKLDSTVFTLDTRAVTVFGRIVEEMSKRRALAEKGKNGDASGNSNSPYSRGGWGVIIEKKGKRFLSYAEELKEATSIEPGERRIVFR